MSIAPSISLVAYETRNPSLVFVKVPGERGRYMLTNRCVVEVACSFCKAIRGEPCSTKHGYIIETHVARRMAWRSKRSAGRIGVPPHDQLPAKPRVKLMLRKPPPA